MQNAVCKDGRAHGMFQFYGANRSGRWAGRLIQLQNLPQNHMPDLAEARELVRTGDYDTLDLLYDDIPDTLSQLIRTAFIARPGYKFIVSDYSAIEARVLAHLAGETWRSKVFAEGKDIYCASASQMFGVPVEKHGVNSHLRQKGKIAELALGYGGSVGALKSMGALEMGLTEEELQPLVDSWRSSNPMITAFWWDIDNAVKTTIKSRVPTEVRGIKFLYKSGMLFTDFCNGFFLRNWYIFFLRDCRWCFCQHPQSRLSASWKQWWSLYSGKHPRFFQSGVLSFSLSVPGSRNALQK